MHGGMEGGACGLRVMVSGSGNGTTIFSFSSLDQIFFHVNTYLPLPGTMDPTIGSSPELG